MKISLYINLNPESGGQELKNELRWAMTKLEQSTHNCLGMHFPKRTWSLWTSLRESCDTNSLEPTFME